MKRSTKQLLSALLVIAMMLSLLVVMPATAAGETKTYGWDLSTSVSTTMTNDGVVTAADLAGLASTNSKFADATGIFTVTGTVKSKVSSEKVSDIELDKVEGGTIGFTTVGDSSSVKISIRSGGSGKVSAIALRNTKTNTLVDVTTGTTLSESNKAVAIVDNTVADVTWTGLAAGDYVLVSPTITDTLPDKLLNCATKKEDGSKDNGDPSGRGCRIKVLELTTEVAVEEEESPSPDASSEASAEASSEASAAASTEASSAASAAASSEASSAASAAASTEASAAASAAASTEASAAASAAASTEASASASSSAGTESPNPSAPAESDPPATGANEWTISLDKVPTGATPITAIDTFGDVLEAETKVSELDGVELWVGPDKYKLSKPDGDFPSALAGNTNPEPKDGSTPTKGCYFKFVATKSGELNVSWIVNADKQVWMLDNGVQMPGGTGDKLTAKTNLKTQIIAEAGHTYHVYCTGSKAMLVGYTFDPVEEKIDEWAAALENIPTGTTPVTAIDTFGDVLEAETKVFDSESVELWVGPDKYKLSKPDGDFPSALAGNTNPEPKDGSTPTKGCYFKFVAKADGELNVSWIVNADKQVWMLDNGSQMVGGTGDKLTAKTNLNTQIMAKKGHTYHVFCTGSKAMLVGFTFKAGGFTEAEAEWTKDAILGAGVSITGSDKGDGSLVATVSGPRVGVWVNAGTAWTCADYMTIEMYNEAGEKLDSVLTMDAGNVHTATFHPSLSGKYTFKAILSREEEADIETEMSAAANFVLPIPKPVVTVGVLDGGKLNVSWPRFVEATGYNLYMADSEAGLASATAIPLTVNEYTTDALTVGGTYWFKVETLRNAEKSAMSDAASGTASASGKTIWNYTYYGVSTTAWNEADQKGNDTTLFDVYPDGVIGNAETPFQIRSWGGSGKVQEGDQDGVSFVYTRIPASQNFTLTATIKVDKWRYEGQEGMGLMATDALGSGNDLDKKNEANSVFVNNYMVGAMRFGNGSLGATFGKAFKGNKGVGMIQQVGNPNPAVKPSGWDYTQINLDPYPENKGMTSGTYNILGNEIEVEDANTGVMQRGTVKAGFTQADTLVTEFKLVIERNNTGIYGYYLLPNGDVKVAKTYDRDALLQQDPDSMYVGFFAARHMVINVSDVTLRVDDPENYPPQEVPDTTYITPRINVASPLVSNSEEYNLILTSNVVGTATVTANGDTETVQLVKQREDDKSTGATRYITRGEVKVPVKNGINQIQVSFQPAALEDQGLAPYYDLLNTDAVKTSVSVTYQNKFADRNNLYVSPTGKPGGYGTKDRPLDLYTAVKVAQPGQKVILMEGTYGLTTTVTIEKGISGTQAKPIYLMADPEAATRPVLDGSRLSTSSGIALKGDYWHFYNFSVENCGGSGIAVNGNNNVIEYVDVINNHNTGLQIARGGEVDGVLKYWPSNNLILNCLAMNNRDSSWGGADGFAAKLTSGTGNIFRYCVAAYNADDGWDLFAKSEDGPIGDVIIENCVVYKSGFGLDANGNEITDPNANGNGFKMGGSGVYGNHKVINSYAFYNKAKGVDSNSGPNTEAHNVVSFNNIGPNIRFYTNNDVANTNYRVDNWISFKNDELKDVDYVNEGKSSNSYTTYDEIAAKGTQKKSKWQNDTAYYWTATGTTSTDGTIADPASLFVSTDFNDLVIGYDENGNLCTGDFLKLKDSIPASLASVVPSTDPANYHSPENLMVMATNLSDPYCITPDAAFVVPSSTSSGGGGRDDRGDSSSPATANRVNKRTNGNGDLLITVTDPTGEVLVDVTLPASLAATDKKFVDVPDDHWAADAIYEMAARAIVKGVDDENFDMNSAVTRGTLATMLFRLSNGKEGYPNAFSDVKDDSWYKDAVAWAAKTGVVTGYGDGTFGGDASITREQLAVMLYRYAGLLGMDTTVTGDTSAFTDSASVSSWAVAAMNWAVSNGIINGVGDNTLAPTASATRAQTALMLQRFIALVK